MKPRRDRMRKNDVVLIGARDHHGADKMHRGKVQIWFTGFYLASKKNFHVLTSVIAPGGVVARGQQHVLKSAVVYSEVLVRLRKKRKRR